MKKLRFAALYICTLAASLTASELHEEHIAITPTNMDAAYQKMAKLANKNRKFAGGTHAPESRLALAEKSLSYYGIPLAAHYVREIDPMGSIVTIEDGSIWTISPEDQWVVRNWQGIIDLTIQPNSLSLWNKLLGTKPAYTYRLVNLYTGDSVAANLSLGPLAYDPYTLQIAAIDYFRGEIYLTNGQLWSVDLTSPCQQILTHWYSGNAVIAGTNDTWFSLGNPYILICVEDNNWLPAVRIY